MITEKKPRFKVDDLVTYKDKTTLPGKEYYHMGKNQKGYIGKVRRIIGFNVSNQCYEITVSTRDDTNYTMLESEFEEYESKDYEIY